MMRCNGIFCTAQKFFSRKYPTEPGFRRSNSDFARNSAQTGRYRGGNASNLRPRPGRRHGALAEFLGLLAERLHLPLNEFGLQARDLLDVLGVDQLLGKFK
jgi:hypothetical protein